MKRDNFNTVISCLMLLFAIALVAGCSPGADNTTIAEATSGEDTMSIASPSAAPSDFIASAPIDAEAAVVFERASFGLG